jgi:hypothetical protein
MNELTADQANSIATQVQGFHNQIQKAVQQIEASLSLASSITSPHESQIEEKLRHAYLECVNDSLDLSRTATMSEAGFIVAVSALNYT